MDLSTLKSVIAADIIKASKMDKALYSNLTSFTSANKALTYEKRRDQLRAKLSAKQNKN